MQIFVNNARGGLTLLDVDPLSTIASVKHLLHNSSGAGVEEEQLFYGLRPLDDAETLEDVQIEAGATLYHTGGALGGAGKKKKKNFAKPKKNKHKKKKVKLAVLKLYKVDSNDNVEKIAPECPAESCGAGVFLAKHHNRSHCGRCGYTVFH